jgi:hypothetical protein
MLRHWSADKSRYLCQVSDYQSLNTPVSIRMLDSNSQIRNLMRASMPSPRQTTWDTLSWASRSPRSFARVLLAIAIILGVHYRFHRLTRWDMSSDEGASWASASLPNIREVIVKERQLDPGKLALYDIALHEWIRVFGDSLFALRAMSAVLGSIVIPLMFFAVSESCRLLGDEGSSETRELAGAFAALIYATNVVMIVSDRTARMYPMMMASELTQVTFFVRAQRRGTLVDLVSTAIFTAAMLAINYTSSFLLAGEALWLSCAIVAKGTGARIGELAVVRPGLALALGVALLAPFLPCMFTDSAEAVRTGAIGWIHVQPVSWPLMALHDSSNSPTLFWIFAALGVFGVLRHWHSAPLVPEFLAAWTFGPLLAIAAVSYLIRPMEFPRYILIAYAGMFAFAGFGAATMRRTTLHIALAVLIIYLSASSIHNWLRIYRELGWREAAEIAMRHAARGDHIAVYTYKSIGVVSYNLPPDRRSDVVAMRDECDSAPLLIIREQGFFSYQNFPTARKCYPHLIALANAIEVRGR